MRRCLRHRLLRTATTFSMHRKEEDGAAAAKKAILCKPRLNLMTRRQCCFAHPLNTICAVCGRRCWFLCVLFFWGHALLSHSVVKNVIPREHPPASSQVHGVLFCSVVVAVVVSYYFLHFSIYISTHNFFLMCV
jgi:hypothetical protein